MTVCLCIMLYLSATETYVGSTLLPVNQREQRLLDRANGFGNVCAFYWDLFTSSFYTCSDKQIESKVDVYNETVYKCDMKCSHHSIFFVSLLQVDMKAVSIMRSSWLEKLDKYKLKEFFLFMPQINILGGIENVRKWRNWKQSVKMRAIKLYCPESL